MTIDTKTLIAIAILLIGGGIEMRVAVSRLETGLADVERRVERIENRIDSAGRLTQR